MSARSTGRTPSSPYHQPPSSTNVPSTPEPAGAPPGRRETPSTSTTTKVPLTRRKWLESSIPGLIFGGGGEDTAKESLTTDEEPAVQPQPAVATSRCKYRLQHRGQCWLRPYHKRLTYTFLVLWYHSTSTSNG